MKISEKYVITTLIFFMILVILNVTYIRHLTRHLGYAQDEIATLRVEKDEATQNLHLTQDVGITISKILEIMEKPKSGKQKVKVDSLVHIINIKIKSVNQYNSDPYHQLRRIESEEKKYDINKAFLRSYGIDI